MGRFEKLNDDIQALADKILEDQELCKLIHYPENNPLDQPDINGQRHILNKRLLLFTPKIPLADEEGTYLSIRIPRLKPTQGEHFIISLLCFDIYSHKDIRTIYYGNDTKKGDRAILIMEKIQQLMSGVGLGIGKDNLDIVEEIANTNATFSGYRIWYKNIDFNRGGNCGRIK